MEPHSPEIISTEVERRRQQQEDSFPRPSQLLVTRLLDSMLWTEGIYVSFKVLKEDQLCLLLLS